MARLVLSGFELATEETLKASTPATNPAIRMIAIKHTAYGEPFADVELDITGKEALAILQFIAKHRLGIEDAPVDPVDPDVARSVLVPVFD